MLGMMQVSKRIPFEDPNVLNTVRAVYIGSNVIIALLYLYIGSQISKKKGMPSLPRHRVAARGLLSRNTSGTNVQ
jgi:hypothetical protein